MTDMPRQQLHYIITHYGRSICDEPKRCEALLKDLCPQHKREVNLLVGALREGVAKELLKPNQLLPIEMVISRLSQKLYDELGFDSGLAQWAVESWALALGVKFNSAAITPSSEKGKAGKGSPQIATPTIPVGHAAALQQIKQQQAQSRASQAIIDQFKGWQKIGLQGEKLAVDAPQWAAVIDEKTNLMWVITPITHDEMILFPNPAGIKIPSSDDLQVWTEFVNEEGWCGYFDWRIPTIDELGTIWRSRRYRSLHIREDVFTDIVYERFYLVWSSSESAVDYNYDGAGLVWNLGGILALFFDDAFENGEYDAEYDGKEAYIRLVRSA